MLAHNIQISLIYTPGLTYHIDLSHIISSTDLTWSGLDLSVGERVELWIHWFGQ